ncbi:MAG: hypothetical protein OHK0056_14330 [Bacteriovoracaceae bacterium]
MKIRCFLFAFVLLFNQAWAFTFVPDEAQETFRLIDFDYQFSTVGSYLNLCHLDRADIGKITETNYQNMCQFVLKSKNCEKIPADERVSCRDIADNKIDTLSWGFIKNCGMGLFNSLVDFFTFIKDMVVWTLENFDAQKRQERVAGAKQFNQSMQNYISIEYYKAMSNYPESDSNRKLKATKDVLFNVMKLAVEKITQMIDEKYTSFGCLKPDIRSEKVCKAFGDLIVPPAFLFAAIARGPALISKAVHSHWLKKATPPKKIEKPKTEAPPPENIHVVSDSKGDPRVLQMLSQDRESAQNFLNLGEKLRTSNIDPKLTHIPEFADDVPDHISYYKKAIAEQGLEPERLEILQKFEEEALERIQSQSVTYEWWLAFNHRLSILATPKSKRTSIAGGSEQDFDDYLLRKDAWLTFENYQRAKTKMPQETFKYLSIENATDFFPESIMIPTIKNNGELSIGFLNDINGHGLYPIGLAKTNAMVDGQEMYPDHFYRHDFVHAGNDRYFLSRSSRSQEEMVELGQKYKNYRESVPIEGDRRAAFEFAYFFSTHELGLYIDDVMRKRDTKLVDRKELPKMFTDPSWFKNEELIPAWARESEEGARKFIKMMDQELSKFSEVF